VIFLSATEIKMDSRLRGNDEDVFLTLGFDAGPHETIYLDTPRQVMLRTTTPATITVANAAYASNVASNCRQIAPPTPVAM
jgi:hypothetical protein